MLLALNTTYYDDKIDNKSLHIHLRVSTRVRRNNHATSHFSTNLHVGGGHTYIQTKTKFRIIKIRLF